MHAIVRREWDLIEAPISWQGILIDTLKWGDESSLSVSYEAYMGNTSLYIVDLNIEGSPGMVMAFVKELALTLSMEYDEFNEGGMIIDARN